MANTPRPVAFDTTDGHHRIIRASIQRLKASRYPYVRPRELARAIGCTQAEATLALFYLREVGMAKKRENDGRWYYAEPTHGGPVRA